MAGVLSCHAGSMGPPLTALTEPVEFRACLMTVAVSAEPCLAVQAMAAMGRLRGGAMEGG